jgi:hypothetical protein
MSQETDRIFVLPIPGGEEVARRVRERVADRLARGIFDAQEIDRVESAPLRTFAGDDEAASEFFRRCCVTWEVDQPGPITSHRPIVGPVLVAVKRLVRRALRFQTEVPLSRQRDFNWNLLLVLRELLEARARESPHGSGREHRSTPVKPS